MGTRDPSPDAPAAKPTPSRRIPYRIRGAGVAHTTVEDVLGSAEVRRQLKAGAALVRRARGRSAA